MKCSTFKTKGSPVRSIDIVTTVFLFVLLFIVYNAIKTHVTTSICCENFTCWFLTLDSACEHISVVRPFRWTVVTWRRLALSVYQK